MVNLKNRSFLTLKDYSQEEIRYLLDLAHQLKKEKKETSTAYPKTHLTFLQMYFLTDGKLSAPFCFLFD